VIYADTSALAKLVVAEAETPALRRWISHQEARLVTNAVGVVELRRLAARVSQQAVDTATRLLARIDRLALTPAALTLAAQLPPAELRTLDALHLGSAAELLDLQVVLSYDRRLADAAAGYGLPVVAPR
jgi:predicted nucleic acid-binding protein